MPSLSPLPNGYVRSRSRAMGRLGERAAVLIESLRRKVLRLLHELLRRGQRGVTVHQLTSLSDHTLKDIGLERGGIRAAVMDLERGVDPRQR